jgi:hypothetical protein
VGIIYFASCVSNACQYYGITTGSISSSDRSGSTVLSTIDSSGAEFNQIIWFDFWFGNRQAILSQHHRNFERLGRRERGGSGLRNWEGYTHSLKHFQYDWETNLKHKSAARNTIVLVAVYNDSGADHTLDVALAPAMHTKNSYVSLRVWRMLDALFLLSYLCTLHEISLVYVHACMDYSAPINIILATARRDTKTTRTR